jgi:site-specific DNA-methyltransferase (adenine-specific)
MLGIEEVPCVRADKLTLKQQRAFGLADNKTGELATWDVGLLESELEDLASVFDISALGFERKVSANEKERPKVKEDNGGMIVCPRCGRKFLPGGFDPYDEVGEAE